MNRKFILLSVLTSFLLTTSVNAQAPGGVSAGMKAWFHAEAGVTASGGVVSVWANQASNANLATLVPTGGATSVIGNNAVPFNFHSFMQHSAGGMYKANSVTYTDVFAASEGSSMGVGTAPDQLISLAGNSASSPFDANRANTGTRGAKTEFGNKTTNTGAANYATGTTLNAGNANIFGMRALVGGAVPHQNTYNGLKGTGVAVARPSGSYRFAIGSYPGYFYGTGKSAEVVCHNRQLTANEFSRVESYFALKYGITLGNTTTPVDYLSSNSTIIWPGNATYQNNVTGIGRDDSSALVQKESKAVTVKAKIAIYNDNTAGTFPAMNVDNTTTFAADQSFVMFGDNNGDTLLNTCAMSGKAVRIGRIWKMVKTGAAANVTLAFTATDLPAGITTLLVSTDATFPESATTAIPLATSGTLKYAVMASDNTFFSFASDLLNVVLTPVDITCVSADGGSISSTVTGGLAPISYSWNTTPVQTTSSVSNVQGGTYTLTVTQAAGCATTQSASVTTHFIDLTANLIATNAKCNGDENGTITVVNTNGTPAYNYSLNNQNGWQSGNHFGNLAAGFYKIYLKDANGCTGDDTVSITEPEVLALSIKAMDDYCEISVEPNGNADISLSGGTLPYSVRLNGTPIAPSLKITGLEKGNYTYAVIDKNGCQIEDTFSVAHKDCCFVFVPNAFTPNGDGKNDIFKAASTGNIRLNRLMIYNRFGQMVFNSSDLNKGWDGSMNGAPVDAGTYFYNIKYTCESLKGSKSTELSGDITVIR